MAQTIIHIFGPSGSGTTSLGRQMALNWGFRQLDSDDFYWPQTLPLPAKGPRSSAWNRWNKPLRREATWLFPALCAAGETG